MLKQEGRTEDLAGVSVQAEDGHGQGNGQGDIVLGVLEDRALGQDQVDPHGLHVRRRGGQLGNQEALKTLCGLHEIQNNTLLKTSNVYGYFIALKQDFHCLVKRPWVMKKAFCKDMKGGIRHTELYGITLCVGRTVKA